MTYLYLIESDVDLAEAALVDDMDRELEALLIDARAQRDALQMEEAA